MKLDSEQQRTILIQLIDAAQFPGAARKVINELANAIEGATVDDSAIAMQAEAHINGKLAVAEREGKERVLTGVGNESSAKPRPGERS